MSILPSGCFSSLVISLEGGNGKKLQNLREKELQHRWGHISRNSDKKPNKFLVEVEEFINYWKSFKTDEKKANFKIEPRATHLVNELCYDYLKIYHYSLFREKRDETEPNEGHIGVKYSKMLIENESIPSFIAECGNQTYPKEVMESQIERRMAKYPTALDLLKEIKECLSQEYNCTQMQPSRVKDENKIDWRKIITKKPKSYTKRTESLRKASQIIEERKEEEYSGTPNKIKPFQTPSRRSHKRLNSSATCANTNENISKKDEDYFEINSDWVDEAGIDIINPSMVDEDHQGLCLSTRKEDFPRFHFDPTKNCSSKYLTLLK